MRLEGFSVQDSCGLGVSGSVPLPGITVLFGQNGTGKTRLIEYLDALLAPYDTFRGRQTPEGDVYTYGHLYLRPENAAAGELSSDWAWLSSLAEDLTENPSPHSEIDVERIADLDQKVAWSGLSRLLIEGLVGAEMGVAQAFFNLLWQAALVSYQNFEGGWVDIAIDGRDCPAALRILADVVVHGRPPIPPAPAASKAALVAGRILEGHERYVKVLSFLEFPGDSDVYEQLRLEPPRVVWIEDAADSVDADLAAVVPEPLWTVGPDHGSLVLDAAAAHFLASVAERANEVAPPFVERHGSIVLSPYAPGRARGVETGVDVQFRLAEDGTTIGHAQLGAGIRRWVAASIRIACSERRRPLGHARLTKFDPGLVLLVDEPELHLHPGAHREISKWLIDRSKEGAVVLTASHSPALLDLPSDIGAVVMTFRNQSETVLYDVGHDVLGAISDLADQLGVDRLSWLQLVRGVLAVEGDHDDRVIRHFFGPLLAAEKIVVLPLRGSSNVMALLDSELLARIGVPIRVVLDDTMVVDLDSAPDRPFTPEEKKVRTFLEHRRPGQDITALSYPEPDILCALPEAAVHRAYPDAQFSGWAPLVESWRNLKAKNRPGFKTFVLRRIGLETQKVTADMFLRQVLALATVDDPPPHSLTQAVRSAVNSLAPRAR